jgi:hypothetical protein
MEKQLMLKLSMLLCMAFLFVGCSGSSTIQEIESPELQLTSEGPLYGGANSSTAIWEFDLKEILGNEEKLVSKAKITSIEVLLNESETIPALEKMVLEVTSKNTAMTRVGLYGGTINGGQTITLSVANEQDNLASLFADGKMTFVGDFDLLDEEYLGNVEFTLKVKFELGIK